MQCNEIDERIFTAFVLVIKESSSYSKITLTSVANKLGMSRQALYKTHYQSIDELVIALHYFIDQNPQMKLKKFLSQQAAYQHTDLIHFFAEEILPDLYSKRQYLQILYKGIACPPWTRFIMKSYIDILEPYFKGSEAKTGLSVEFMMQLAITQTLTIIANWMNQPKPENPATFSKKFIFLMTHSINDLISINPD